MRLPVLLVGCGQILVSSVIALGPPAAQAHHSFAMFDRQHEVVLNGTVTSFNWGNPHCSFDLIVLMPDGDRHYLIETGGPNVLVRAGWKYSDVKVGEKLKVLLAPLRNGSSGGGLEQVMLQDGRILTGGLPPEPGIKLLQ